jgi:C-terminal processing protease CtpA/Prc
MKKVIRLITPMIAVLALLSACKKDKGSSTPPVTRDKIKDSVLLYANDIYLWYQQIPTTFDPQTYADPDAIMQAIRHYSTEPGFSQPVDRWSFGMKQTDWNNLSSGVAADFGFSVFFLQEGDLRVKYVERASPAGLKGIHRGWRVTKINGNTNITTGNSSFIVTAIFNSTSGTFTFQKPDGTSVDVSMTAASYQEHPVFLDSVYNAGARKVGYMVLNSFLGDTTELTSEFNRVFNKFNSQGVTDVAVDLRYNGGGYVSVSQQLANFLVNSTATGGLMMSEVFNDKYASWDETTNYSKLGPLNAAHVYFIVTNNTASASELVINNVKPYMDVKLVGPSSTYGKPVGFFPIPVGDWYIFPVSFRSTNKNGAGNYFNGIAVDAQRPDGLDKDWGDVSESLLASVLNYVNTGSFERNPSGEIIGSAAPQVTPQLINSNQKFDARDFKGAVLTRHKTN